MGILGWIVFGFFAGLVARAVMPGDQKLGFFMTTLLGVGGSFVGGALTALLTGGPILAFRASGFIGAVIGSIVLLFLFYRSRRV